MAGVQAPCRHTAAVSDTWLPCSPLPKHEHGTQGLQLWSCTLPVCALLNKGRLVPSACQEHFSMQDYHHLMA